MDDERDKGQELKNIDEVNTSTSVKEKTAKELRKDKIKKINFRKYIPYAVVLVILIIIAGSIIVNVFFGKSGKGTAPANGSAVTDSKTADNNASSTGTTHAVSSDVQFDITKIKII